MGHFNRPLKVEGDVAHQALLGDRKLEELLFHVVFAGMFFGLVTKHVCDRWTDGQNYDSQDHASIAASRGKNCYKKLVNIPKTY